VKSTVETKSCIDCPPSRTGDPCPDAPRMSGTGDLVNTEKPMYPQIQDPMPGVELRYTHGFADRVSYSMGRKVNIGNYESIEIHESFSTDLLPGETREQALARAAGFVERTVTARVSAVRKEFGLE